jgi:hypothetical protein
VDGEGGYTIEPLALEETLRPEAPTRRPAREAALRPRRDSLQVVLEEPAIAWPNG